MLSSNTTPGERCSWLTTTRSAPLMMNVPSSVSRGRSPRYTSFSMISPARLSPPASFSQTIKRSFALRGAAYVMSRSMHSSTEYFGSPSEADTYSSVKFSFTSDSGKISEKTRSSPKSHCSSGFSWGSTSFSKERSWTSNRLGIGITDLSLAKLTTGRPSLLVSNDSPLCWPASRGEAERARVGRCARRQHSGNPGACAREPTGGGAAMRPRFHPTATSQAAER